MVSAPASQGLPSRLTAKAPSFSTLSPSTCPAHSLAALSPPTTASKPAPSFIIATLRNTATTGSSLVDVEAFATTGEFTPLVGIFAPLGNSLCFCSFQSGDRAFGRWRTALTTEIPGVAETSWREHAARHPRGSSPFLRGEVSGRPARAVLQAAVPLLPTLPSSSCICEAWTRRMGNSLWTQYKRPSQKISILDPEFSFSDKATQILNIFL